VDEWQRDGVLEAAAQRPEVFEFSGKRFGSEAGELRDAHPGNPDTGPRGSDDVA